MIPKTVVPISGIHEWRLFIAAFALLAIVGSTWAGSFRVRYSIRGSGRDITVQAESSPEALASAAYAEPILPEEAKSRIGETVAVRGLVERVAFVKGNAFPNFGAYYPRQVFTGFVRAQDVNKRLALDA